MHSRWIIIAFTTLLFGSLNQHEAIGAGQPCQREWSSGFSLSGTNAAVNAMIEYDDGLGGGPALYVGGDFTEADGVTVNYIARWDGERWSALGDAEVGVDNSVQALAVFDDGHGPALFVGGRFTTAGGAPASRIARWDGRHWSALGEGFDGPVHAMTIWGGGNGLNPALYAGGSFSNSGSTAVRNLGKWNSLTSTWSAAGGPTANWNGAIRTMAVFDDGTGTAPALYVGGEFTIGGGVSANYIVKRNNLGWSTLNDTSVPQINGTNGPVNSLAVFDDDGSGPDVPQLYVGGSNHILSDNNNGVSQWNGSSWSLLAAPLEGSNYPLSARVLLAVNDPKTPALLAESGGVVARWAGSFWSIVGASGFTVDYSSTNVQLNTLAMARTGGDSNPFLFAGGYFTASGASGAANVAQLKHGDWAPLGGQRGQGDWVSTLATFDDGRGANVYAGRVRDAPGAGGVVRWDGACWSTAGDGLRGSVYELATLTVGGETKPSLYAGGYIALASSDSTPGGIARFDGTTWQNVGIGLASTAPVAIATVDDGLGLGPVLYAGGNFPGGVMRLNGDHWEPLGEGIAGNVQALASFDDGTGPALYAGGSFVQAGVVRAKSIARWNPRTATWSDVGGGMNVEPGGSNPQYPGPGVSTLAVFDDGLGQGPALYAAGYFTTAGSVNVNNIARWRGAADGWTTVGGGITNLSCPTCVQVFRLRVLNDGRGSALYAGGLFRYAGGVPARDVARWDGRNWGGLDQGIDFAVFDMTAFDEDNSEPSIYAGGVFETAGGLPARDFARWSCITRCVGDISPSGGDGLVNIDDLVAVITAWGSCTGCVEDIDTNGVVDIDDLVTVITGWGPCD